VAVVTAQLNNDKIPDLIVVTSSEVEVMLGKGGGRFARPVVIYSGTTTSSGVSVLRNLGDGTFAAALNYAVGGGTATSIAVHHFTKDGSSNWGS
jgi:hypothetical protein